MRVFKDEQSRDWSITVDVGQIQKVRDLAKVDLMSIFGEDARRFFSDPVVLVNTLYVLCREQCAARNLSDVDFGRLFRGDVLEAAADALLEEVVSFFPSSRQRILRATIDKSKEITGPVEKAILSRIAAIDATSLLNATASPAS